MKFLRRKPTLAFIGVILVAVVYSMLQPSHSGDYLSQWQETGAEINQDAASDDDVVTLEFTSNSTRWGSKDIPFEITRLRNLEKLSLTANHFPAEIGKLGNLKELTLIGNQLSIVPNLQRLEHLESLTLKCRFLDLSSRLGKLPPLKSIDLDSNRFTTFPKEVANVATLANLV